jgi:hypothetical protein
MARFQLTKAFFLGTTRYRAGTTVADTVGNALPGDIVWTALSAATMPHFFSPIDGAATTMKAASRFASVPNGTAISGVDSIG